MNILTKSALIICVFAISPATAATKDVGIGQREFEANCAACHGISGKGDGPMAGYLNQRTADLTLLAKNNNGVFPFDRVYQVIDGREILKGHGTREMPIWGRQYDAKATAYYSDFPAPYNVGSFVRGRILALTTYVYELQAK